MQLFHIISVLIPLVIILVLPRLLRARGYEDKGKRWLLLLACGLFFISWYLPSPLVEGNDTSIITHLVGGGVFCGILWLYLVRTRRRTLTITEEIISLFALVSSLGVINELFEFFLVKTALASILITDTSWDLVANTIGAAFVYAIYRFGKHIK